jgi:hypothetical protein
MVPFFERRIDVAAGDLLRHTADLSNDSAGEAGRRGI